MADTNSTIAPANPADRITAGTHFEADGLTLSCIAGKPGFATADLRPRLASPAWSDPSANVFGWHGTTGQIAGLIGRGRWTSAPCSK